MNKGLHQAIWQGSLESVRSLLDAGADVNAVDMREWSPLARAIERRHPEIARLLLKRSADVHARDRRGRQPLLWATQYGSDDIVEALVERGADVTAADDRGKTPLLQAVRHGRTTTVQMLLKRGQWPKSTRNYYWSQGFFLAIRDRRARIGEAFLDAGQSADSTRHQWDRGDFREVTPLMEAATTGDLRIVALLLRHGADVQKTYKRRSALTEALSRHGEQSSVARTFLEGGAHLGLEEAVVIGDLAQAERLLVDGADVERRDGDGQSLLVWAAFHGRSDAVQLLVRFGADPNARDRFGVGALMGAVAVGDIALAEFLVQHGADPSADGPSWRKTALAYAAGAGQIEAARWLLERFGLGTDRGVSALTAGAASGHLEMVRLLVDAGVEADAHTSYLYGRRALMWAAWHGNVPMTHLLLERGADVNARESPGRLAVSFAAGAGRKRVIHLLIEQGLASEQKDEALLEALQGGHSDKAQILLEGGADPNSVGYAQRTALMWAAKNGRVNLVQALLDKGAAVDAVDKDGKTALIWAERAMCTDIAVLLER